MGYNPKVIKQFAAAKFSQIQQQWTHFSKTFQMSGRTPFKLKKKPILKFRLGDIMSAGQPAPRVEVP